MLTLKVRNKTGGIVDLNVDEIISIDGVPFKGQATDFRDDLIHLGGRVSALESLFAVAFGGRIQLEQADTERSI